MSDWSPPPRPGFTRTGKSLKAVRRYYALKDQLNKRKKTPDRDDRDEERPNRDERYSASSKRKRSPDDDKLSKRIAAELKVQAEANEKRTQRQIGMPMAPTDRSDLPLIVQPREAGPTFITAVNEINEAITGVQPYKSVVQPSKSTKSNKSAGIQLGTVPGELPDIEAYQLGPTSKGCLVTCVIFGLTYIMTWMLMMLVKSGDKKEEASFKSIAWLAISSPLVIVAISYWFCLRPYLKHAVGSLILMVLSTVNLIVYMIYSIIIHAPEPDSSKPHQYINENNPLNFWLSIGYLVFHIASMSFMIKHLLNLVYGQIREKSGEKVGDQDQQMSLYLAPG